MHTPDLDISPAPAPSNRLIPLLALMISTLAILVRAWMAWRTHYTGEDALITLRYAENLASGHGFVFNPGERVLGTTTPLYTLLLALFAWLHLDAMMVGKACNILADGVTCFLVAKTLARREIGQPILGLFAALFYAFDTLPISISISGMETAMVTCASLGAIYAYLARREIPLYVLGALLFLLRIDTLPLFAILAVALALQTQRISWRALGYGLLLLLPWLVFATVYFGSPLPASLLAKLTAYGHPTLTPAKSISAVNRANFLNLFAQGWIQRGVSALFLVGVWGILSPQRTQRDTERREKQENDPQITADYRRLQTRGVNVFRKEETVSFFSLCPSVSSVVKSSPLVAPLLWLLLYFGVMFFAWVPTFRWYFLPPMPLFLVIAAVGAGRLVSGRVGQGIARVMAQRQRLAWGAALAACSILGLVHLRGIVHDVVRLQEFNDAQLRPIGEWLGAQVRSDERILLEPIGYIGYYSRRNLLDEIGLVSPEVLPSYRTDAPLEDMIKRFRPEWLCLRKDEELRLNASRTYAFVANYRLVRQFAVPNATTYVIYRRNE